jgi:aryl-alcohol dehydrogenase-like predicted oxidoreductase
MLVATKVRLRTGAGPSQVGLGRLHIVRTAETSLKRLDRVPRPALPYPHWMQRFHDRDRFWQVPRTLVVTDVSTRSLNGQSFEREK